MSTSSSTDKIMNEMNDWAKAEGRYLGKAFWEIPSQSESILDVPSTPEADRRLAALRARRLERRKRAVAQSEPVAPRQEAEADIHEKSSR
jgi:hypothetical protein